MVLKPERFTEQAKEVLAASQQVMQRFKHSQWDAEHIFPFAPGSRRQYKNISKHPGTSRQHKRPYIPESKYERGSKKNRHHDFNADKYFTDKRHTFSHIEHALPLLYEHPEMFKRC